MSGQAEKEMHNALLFDFEVGLERRGMWEGSPAFGCGLPFRGDGRPAQAAGACLRCPATLLAGALIKVRWLPEVAWQKRIRISNGE